ncbi:sigma-70 family RNA polymerase sigma factor [Micromonospora sp. NPDC049679]|uniref:RNA polymerase sigma factor n=1 Tax=Micromonospora sp. NPDC049679 TaxID=3155920 RepID=UPI003410B219
MAGGVRDEAWHDGVVRRYRDDMMRRVGGRLGGFGADTEDVVQAVFLTAWRRRDHVPDDPLPWLYDVTNKLLANYWRKRRRQRSTLMLLGAETTVDEGGLASWAEAQDLRVALATLARADQQILTLRYDCDLTATDIAATLRCTPEAARKRLERARERLRRAMKRVHGRGDARHAGVAGEPIGGTGVDDAYGL